jgi:hypothetical protein
MLVCSHLSSQLISKHIFGSGSIFVDFRLRFYIDTIQHFVGFSVLPEKVQCIFNSFEH